MMINNAGLRDILCDVFSVEPEEIAPDTSLTDDLFADDMDFEELSFIFEEEYGIEPDPKTIKKQKTVRMLEEYVERHLND